MCFCGTTIDVVEPTKVLFNAQVFCRPVMLTSNLAMLCQVETQVLNQAVKQNQRRFPERYRFQLTKEEANLTSQFVRSISAHGWRRVLPCAFTERGIAMMSGILCNNTSVELVKATSRKFG